MSEGLGERKGDLFLINRFVLDWHFHCVAGSRYRMMSSRFRHTLISKQAGFQIGRPKAKAAIVDGIGLGEYRQQVLSKLQQ